MKLAGMQYLHVTLKPTIEEVSGGPAVRPPRSLPRARCRWAACEGRPATLRTSGSCVGRVVPGSTWLQGSVPPPSQPHHRALPPVFQNLPHFLKLKMLTSDNSLLKMEGHAEKNWLFGEQPFPSAAGPLHCARSSP